MKVDNICIYIKSGDTTGVVILDKVQEDCMIRFLAELHNGMIQAVPVKNMTWDKLSKEAINETSH